MTDLRAEQLPPDVLARLTSPANSNRAFGERMQYRLQRMLRYPDSFTPSYKRRYQTLLRHADSLSPHQAYAMTATLLGPDSSKGYEPLPQQANLRFPEAHAEELRKQVGWYFVVGSCTGRNGKEYGVELMFFRYALLPRPAARRFGLSDIDNQVVELHFAISEAGERHYRMKPIVVAGTTGLVEYRNQPFYARMGRNVMESLRPDNLFPLRLQAQGTARGAAGAVDLGIDLTFASSKGILLQGAEGCSPCCGGVGTLYYSIPNLKLDAQASRLRLKGEEVALDSGKFWFDHQWATGMIPGGSPRSAVLRAAGSMAPAGAGGWDWFMAQFDGDHEMTFSSLHSNEYKQFYAQTGPNPPGTMRVNVNGKYMDPQSKVSDVTGTMAVTDWIKIEDTPDPDQYWPTHTWHPHRWEFQLGPEVPEHIRRFTMVPIVDTGQAGFFAFGGQYQEGAVYLEDGGGKRLGRGFAESVLYAENRRNMLQLAGLPATDGMLKATEGERPSLLQKLATLLYLVLPANKAELKRQITLCYEHGLLPPSSGKAQ